MRFMPVTIFIGTVLVLLVLLLQRFEPEYPQGLMRKPLPELELTAFNGKTSWNQEALQGQVSVINFFASWCAPCEAEMPELRALKVQESEANFIGIAWNDRKPVLKKWLKKNANPFNSVWLDSEGRATMALGMSGIPETLIVDAQGNIRYRLPGVMTAEIRQTVIAPILHQLLAEASDAP